MVLVPLLILWRLVPWDNPLPTRLKRTRGLIDVIGRGWVLHIVFFLAGLLGFLDAPYFWSVYLLDSVYVHHSFLLLIVFLEHDKNIAEDLHHLPGVCFLES